MDGLATSVKENGTSLDEFTEPEPNRIALGEIVSGTDDLVAAMIREGATAQEVQAARRQGNEELRTTMRQAGFTKKQIDNYIASVKKTPKQQKTELSVLYKKEGLKTLNQDITRLNKRKIDIQAPSSRSLPAPPARSRRRCAGSSSPPRTPRSCGSTPRSR